MWAILPVDKLLHNLSIEQLLTIAVLLLTLALDNKQFFSCRLLNSS